MISFEIHPCSQTLIEDTACRASGSDTRFEHEAKVAAHNPLSGM